MIKIWPKNRFLRVVLVALVLGLVYLGLYLSSTRPPAPPVLVSSSPANNALQVGLLDPVIFEFETPVLASDFAIASTPSLSWQVKNQGQYMVVATHSPAFSSATRYSLALSWRGASLLTHNLTALQTQEDVVLIQNMKAELARDYPLGQKTPYETTAFRVVYSAPLTLEITLKNTTLSAETALADIRSWVQSNGLDPASHKYVVSD